MPASGRTIDELRLLWKKHLDEAEARLECARTKVKELEIEMRAPTIPSPDLHYAYQRALRAQNLALSNYARVLIIFNDLVLRGSKPEEEPDEKCG